MPARFLVTASVKTWDMYLGEFIHDSIEHWSSASTESCAKDDAREVWSEFGHTPTNIQVEVVS
jgi:hypothetical protein